MRARAPFLPHKLDVQAFIESGETLSGQADLAGWPRVAEALAEGVDPATVPPLTWTATGREVPRRVGGPERWLDLSVQGEVPLTCQRCLQPVSWHIDLTHTIRFEGDEAAAAQLDADSEDDVLPMARSFNLLELLEDEVIMDSPLVPRHDVCPEDVDAWMSDDAEVTPDGQLVAPEDAAAEAKPNPFAALAALKKKD
ncbi:MAG: hypothetical protein RI907_1960 [Pseudomonadota bacterium]|jgi:uncharacterized protein